MCVYPLHLWLPEWQDVVLRVRCVVAHCTSPLRPASSSLLSPSIPFCFPFFHLPSLPLTTLLLFSLKPFFASHSMSVLLHFYLFFCYIIFLQSFPLSPPLNTLCILFPLSDSALPLYSLLSQPLFVSSLLYFSPLPPYKLRCLSLCCSCFLWLIPPPSHFLALFVLSPSFPLSITVLHLVLCLFFSPSKPVTI